MSLTLSFCPTPTFALNIENKPRSRVRVRAAKAFSGGTVNKALLVEKNEKNNDTSLIDRGNGSLSIEEHKEVVKEDVDEELKVLWDDGYGSKTVKDYMEASKDMIKHDDGGPPRWFCPIAAGKPLKDSPVLFFLPGMDGTGMGLILHEKALGKAFEVRCLHIPIRDRTPFEGLVKLVEETVRLEHASSPNKPIYLVGDSFGGCLALAVASRNPTIDLVVIVANPTTSFSRSQLQPLFPMLEAMPDELHSAVPYLLSFVMGDPVKLATINIEKALPPRLRFKQLANNLVGLLSLLPGLAEIIPKDTLLWKLKLLKSADAYANSRLHAVRAEVLVLASGKDSMLPSADEAQRLKDSLQNCKVRKFKDNGHTLLMEDSISLLTVIKGTSKYRRSKKLDYVSHFLPPSKTEFDYGFNQFVGLFRYVTSSAMFSTLDSGKIVRGLEGVPAEGPVLLVGYHNLLGLELFSLVEEFLREKSVLVRGVAHPDLFMGRTQGSITEFSIYDMMNVLGAVPVSASALFKLLSTRSHVLLYPGGAHEALHKKGEEYKLIWPDQPEFVRMAAQFEATIVPFAAVGEDDIAEVILDYDDVMKIPILNDYIREANKDVARVREFTNSGEVVSQDFYFPGLMPKLPGRFYYLFGKPIETKGKKKMLKDKDNANELYLHVKSEVESSLAYLIKKREEDPYRNIFDRIAYRTMDAPLHEVPTFNPE